MKNKGDTKSIKEWLVNKHFVSIFIFTSALMIINQPILMNTLFPYCVPWMYYGFSMLMVIGVLGSIQDIHTRYYTRSRKNNTKKKKKGNDGNDLLAFETTFWLIITSSIVALPNRFIPIDDTKVITGKVVDKTKWKLLSKTTGGWQNYVKIKIDGEDTFFWYNLDYENKEYGTRCLISERKGIWGLRYVTNVDFIVE